MLRVKGTPGTNVRRETIRLVVLGGEVVVENCRRNGTREENRIGNGEERRDRVLGGWGRASYERHVKYCTYVDDRDFILLYYKSVGRGRVTHRFVVTAGLINFLPLLLPFLFLNLFCFRHSPSITYPQPFYLVSSNRMLFWEFSE